jgi:hypothetical protein
MQVSAVPYPTGIDVPAEAREKPVPFSTSASRTW